MKDHGLPLKSIGDIAELPTADYDTLYTHGVAPEVENLEGRYRGRVVGLIGGDGFTISEVEKLLLKLIDGPFAVWKGKTFGRAMGGRGQGVDLFFKPHSPTLRGGFETRIDASRFGPGEVVILDYDQPFNPRPARRLFVEMRLLSGGLLLGRAGMVLNRRHRQACWIALERCDLPGPPAGSPPR